MADNVTYTIRIVDEAQGNGASAKTKKILAQDETGISPTSTDKKFTRMAAASAISLVNTYVTSEINRVNIRTGHTTLQNQISYKYGLAKRITAMTGSFIATFATGNPIGAMLGLGGLMARGIQLVNSAIDLNIEQNVERIGLEQMQIRAGAGGNRNEEKY